MAGATVATGDQGARSAADPFPLHVGGKIEVRSRIPLDGPETLALAYTPGVGQVCEAIRDDPDQAYRYTGKANTVAVVTDGTAVLGLGDIGPRAALPVMEGKALLFKELAGVDAFPLCLDVSSVDRLVEAVLAVAPGFGGINLEDIASPACFEVEARLREALDIPVFHDDQHGTAVVVLAALENAVRVVGKSLDQLRVVISGMGAAGVAVTRIISDAGVPDVVGVDRMGAIHAGRSDLSDVKRGIAETTNPRRVQGSLRDALVGADVFIGLSGPRLVSRPDVERMADAPIVFALANPTPEILPQEVGDAAAVMATGRSDFPNQINNVLCFPGMFRGALDARATTFTEGMEMAAARAIAGCVSDEDLARGVVVPSVFDRAVVPRVAAAVAEAARAEGVVRA